MSDLLADMAASSRARVAAARATRAEADLREAALANAPRPLRLGEAFDLIAEVKLVSPAEGVLSDGADPLARVTRQAEAYARAGAAAISVLTEPARFGGSLDHLAAVARAVDVPCMRKDFLVDPWQVWEARAAGASGVLLITRMLDDAALVALRDAAAAAELFVLVEAFDADDLRRSAALLAGWTGRQPALVGVNVRDLSTLGLDPDRLERLAPMLPPGVKAVAESGIHTPDDARRARGLGYAAALVGTSLMKAADPARLAAALLAAGRADGAATS